jgi:hypothetical protein
MNLSPKDLSPIERDIANEQSNLKSPFRIKAIK